MKEIKYSEIVNDELFVNSYDHNVHTGFLEDYRVLTCLLRRYNPKTIFEVGTNIGNGINVMGTALPNAKIFSLDLPYILKEDSRQYPVSGDGEDLLGSSTKLPYTQLRENSLYFDFSEYPCEAYYIDGEHIELNVFVEVREILKLKPTIIILHDIDMPDVMSGLQKAFNDNNEYNFYRVLETRVSYLIKKTEDKSKSTCP